MTGKRSAHERFPEVIDAAVRVFARDGYRSAHMSDVSRGVPGVRCPLWSGRLAAVHGFCAGWRR